MASLIQCLGSQHVVFISAPQKGIALSFYLGDFPLNIQCTLGGKLPWGMFALTAWIFACIHLYYWMLDSPDRDRIAN